MTTRSSIMYQYLQPLRSPCETRVQVYPNAACSSTCSFQDPLMTVTRAAQSKCATFASVCRLQEPARRLRAHEEIVTNYSPKLNWTFPHLQPHKNATNPTCKQHEATLPKPIPDPFICRWSCQEFRAACKIYGYEDPDPDLQPVHELEHMKLACRAMRRVSSRPWMLLRCSLKSSGGCCAPCSRPR